MKLISVITFCLVAIIPFSSCQSQTSDKKQTTTKTPESKASEKSEVEHLTSTTFKQKVFDYQKNKDWKFLGDKPCIVDFYATWCGPCKAMSPIVEELAKEYKGKINIYKVDVDQEPELSSVFGIQSIPTVLFCPVADKPQGKVGGMNKLEFEEKIKSILKIK